MKSQLKKSKEFKVGGWARSKSFGTRVYRVINVVRDIYADKDANGEIYFAVYNSVTLQKSHETNRGKPIFTNSKPFTVNDLPYDHSKRNGTLRWYYPAEATAPMPYYTPRKYFPHLKGIFG